MEMRRRQVLAVIGGGVILAAGGAVAGLYATSEPTEALAPWQDAGDYQDARRRALSYAILAPNPHNRQPWLVDLSVPDRATLFVDRTRLLPETDPFERQIAIGLGCFLELMAMAAAADGFRVDLDLFPDGSDAQRLGGGPVAVATFVKDPAVAKDPLFDHVLARRSNKEPFDLALPVAQPALSDLLNSGKHGTTLGATNRPEAVETLRKLTHDALLLEIETPRVYRESVELFRIGRAEIEANPDGIVFSGPFFEAMALTGLFTRDTALDTNSFAYAQGVAAVLECCDSAMAHIWMVTPGNSRAEQIAAGRDWLRINLAATALGLGLQPLSQALQEYPEMQDLRARLHRSLAPEGGTIQMLGRLGYGPAVGPAPHWPLDSRIIPA